MNSWKIRETDPTMGSEATIARSVFVDAAAFYDRDDNGNLACNSNNVLEVMQWCAINDPGSLYRLPLIIISDELTTAECMSAAMYQQAWRTWRDVFKDTTKTSLRLRHLDIWSGQEENFGYANDGSHVLSVRLYLRQYFLWKQWRPEHFSLDDVWKHLVPQLLPVTTGTWLPRHDASLAEHFAQGHALLRPGHVNHQAYVINRHRKVRAFTFAPVPA